MIVILLFSFLASAHLYICGYIFYSIFLNKKIDVNVNLCEFFFYGAFILSFISLFLNFFISLNPIINTLIYSLPFILFFIFFFNKILFKHILRYSILISLFAVIIVSYDGTYRPDAGLYHLPYISNLNENRIIIGLSNVNFRYGHTSIMQYLSSIYNNLLFGEKGITIPLVLIYINLIGYFLLELLTKNNDKKLKIFILIIIIFISFRVNRYSDFGNDAPANLLFFYLIIEYFKKDPDLIKIKKLIFISTFIFLNKITLFLCFLFPLILIFNNFKLKNLINKASFFSLLFLTLFLIKNILISGCLIFPAEKTCITKLSWYDKDKSRNSNAVTAKIENEAWAKGWLNQNNEKKNFEEFLRNFNWVKTWIYSDGIKTIKKLSPFFTFIFILLTLLIALECKSKMGSIKKKEIEKEYLISLLISFLGSLMWFLMFPVFRYGYGYLITVFALSNVILVQNFKLLNDNDIFKKITIYVLSILFIFVLAKNFLRIYKGINKNLDPWPNIYSANKLSKNNKTEIKKHLPVIINNHAIFYQSNDGECYYSPKQNPCTNYSNLENLQMTNLKIFKMFYFKN